jgi:hypothetical protein
MRPDLLLPWLSAFVLTHLVEGPVYALWMRPDHPVPAALLRSAVLQTTTHPVLWCGFFDLMDLVGGYTPAVILAEAAVIAAESALLAWMWPEARAVRVAGAAVSANVLSTVVGLLRG